MFEVALFPAALLEGAAFLNWPAGTLASRLTGRPLAHRPARRASGWRRAVQGCRC